MSLQSPLRQARGSGSAGHGASHGKIQRLTSVLLVALMLWVMVSVAMLDFPATHQQLVYWVGYPFNSIVLIALLIVGGIHGALGMQMIIEDYVGGHARAMLIGLVKILAFLAVIVGIVAVLRLGVFVLMIQLLQGVGS